MTLLTTAVAKIWIAKIDEMIAEGKLQERTIPDVLDDLGRRVRRQTGNENFRDTLNEFRQTQRMLAPGIPAADITDAGMAATTPDVFLPKLKEDLIAQFPEAQRGGKRCPSSKVRDRKTKRCRRKQCPGGKTRNRKTKRCRKTV